MKLEGLKVIDLSSFLPGPYLTMALADHGAQVVKIEMPGEGDAGRHIGLPDAFLAAGALPTLHDRYGISTQAVVDQIKAWQA